MASNSCDKRPLTMKELYDIVENLSDNEEIDISYIPPETDEITDEEDIDDNEIGDNDNLPGEVAGTFELFTNRDEEENEGIAEEQSLPLPGPSRKKKKVEKNNKETVKWTTDIETYSSQPISKEEENIALVKEKVDGMSPLEVFHLFFDNEVLQKIVHYSTIYAAANNRHAFQFGLSDLKKFLGVLILSGYHILPQTDCYWSLDEDKGLPIIRKAMSRNRFREIKRNLHLSDNDYLDKNDKFSKLRPIYDMMNERFLQFGIFTHHLSIDEEMVPYFGRHSAKMFIKGKPVRFGFKIWCLASPTGYLYKFEPYGGKSNKVFESGLGLGADVVLNLLSVVDNPSGHRIYFDNFFTGMPLLKNLKERGFYATGTIRENRIPHCPLKSSKVAKKNERGTFDSAFDQTSAITIVRWNDNAVVTIATNIGTIEPVVKVKRYNRKEKKDVTIAQPNTIADYNAHMGGVDLHDNGVANYRIGIRGKKWWWPLFTNLLGNALVNAWKIYQIANKDQNMSQFQFRSYVATSLLKSEDQCTSNQEPRPTQNLNLGRPSKNSLPDEIRFDNIGHVIEKHDQKSRRRCRLCHNTTMFLCKKCQVHLHSECFATFHKK